MVVIAVAIALSVISRYAAIARTGYEIAELKRTVATLEKEHEVLELTVASLKAPGRIQEIATSRLGMQLPDKVYYASAGSSATKKMVGNEAVNTASAPWIVSKVEARSNR
jgi:cell division protein FtsL